MDTDRFIIAWIHSQVYNRNSIYVLYCTKSMISNRSCVKTTKTVVETMQSVCGSSCGTCREHYVFLDYWLFYEHIPSIPHWHSMYSTISLCRYARIYMDTDYFIMPCIHSLVYNMNLIDLWNCIYYLIVSSNCDIIRGGWNTKPGSLTDCNLRDSKVLTYRVYGQKRFRLYYTGQLLFHRFQQAKMNVIWVRKMGA